MPLYSFPVARNADHVPITASMEGMSEDTSAVAEHGGFCVCVCGWLGLIGRLLGLADTGSAGLSWLRWWGCFVLLCWRWWFRGSIVVGRLGWCGVKAVVLRRLKWDFE